MTLEQLQSLLQPEMQEDVIAVWERFRAEKEDGDVAAFLTYLRRHELIGADTLLRIHANDDVELTPFSGLATQFPGDISLLDASEDETSLVPPAEGPRGTRIVEPETPLETLDADESNDGLPAELQSRYRLMGTLGRGAMGAVYVAKDLNLRRKVAYKKMTARAVRSQQGRRFLSEAQIMAQLDHPGIVPVYGLERARDGRPAYAMKLVQGRTLKSLFRQARHTIEETGEPGPGRSLIDRLEIFLKVCDAMEYAHSKGVIHRDLKPANIMIGQYHEVYVMDWGVARLFSREQKDPTTTSVHMTRIGVDAQQRTRMGSIVGTPQYMAPEQAMGLINDLGPHTDIFSLGLVLFETILLKHAYPGKQSNEILIRARIGDKDKVHPYSIGENVPPALLPIIHKATELMPDRRHTTVAELAEEIRQVLRAQSTGLPSRRGRGRFILQGARLLSRLAVLGFAAVGVGAAAWMAWPGGWQLGSQQEIDDTVLLSRVSEQSQRIDGVIRWCEGQVEGLALAASYSVTLGARVEPLGVDLSAESTVRASDVWEAGDYDALLVDGRMAYLFPPQSRSEGSVEQRERLSGLNTHFRQIVTTSISDGPEIRGHVVRGPKPIRWAYVALEDTGLLMAYPGGSGWHGVYDPRHAPWYQARPQRTKCGFLPAYLTEPRMMSCSKALPASEGQAGVVGVDISLDVLAELVLEPVGVAGVRGAVLIDDRDAVRAVKGETSWAEEISTLELQRPASRGLTQITDRSGVQHTVAWSRLERVPWTYVFAVDPAVPVTRMLENNEDKN